TTSGAEEPHSTGPGSSLQDPSEYWPPALNGCCPPPAIVALSGLIVIACNTGVGGCSAGGLSAGGGSAGGGSVCWSAAGTAALARPLIPLLGSVAVIVAVPDTAPAVASPLVSMETSSGAEDPHSTGPCPTRHSSDLYWPPALNGCCPPPAIVALSGLIVIACKTGV